MSHRTFVCEMLAYEHKLPIVQKLQIPGFGDVNQFSKEEYTFVKVTLNNMHNKKVKKDVNALEVNKIIRSGIINIPDKLLKEKLKENSLKYAMITYRYADRCRLLLGNSNGKNSSLERKINN